MDGQDQTAGAESAWQNPNPSGPRNAAAKAEAATPSRLPCAESAGSGSGTREPGPAAAEVGPGVEERPVSQALGLPKAHTSWPQAAPGPAEQACHAAGARTHAPGVMEPEQLAALPAFASAANCALNEAVRELEAQVKLHIDCDFSWKQTRWSGRKHTGLCTGRGCHSKLQRCQTCLAVPEANNTVQCWPMCIAIHSLARLAACGSAGGCGGFGAARDVRPRRRHGRAPEACAGARLA